MTRNSKLLLTVAMVALLTLFVASCKDETEKPPKSDTEVDVTDVETGIDVRDQIVNILKRKKAEEAFKKYIDDLRTNAKIKYIDENAKEASKKAKSEDTVLVNVNGEKITAGDVNDVFHRQQIMMQSQGRSIPPQMEESIRKNILEDLVNIRLIMQDAEKRGVQVSDAEVQEILDQEIKRIGTEQQLEEQLTKIGKTLDQFKKSIREYIIMQKLNKQVTADLSAPTEEEIEAFFNDHKANLGEPEQVHAYHILVKVPSDATPEQLAEAEKKIKDIRKKIVDEGADFQEMARTNSDCPSSSRGGDLGTFPRGQMVKEFEDTAFSLKVGEVSEVVKTRFGYHIIKVTEHMKGKEAILSPPPAGTATSSDEGEKTDAEPGAEPFTKAAPNEEATKPEPTGPAQP